MGDSDGRGCPQIDVAAISRLLPSLSRGYPIPSIFGGGGRKYLFLKGKPPPSSFLGPIGREGGGRAPPFFASYAISSPPGKRRPSKLASPFSPYCRG